MTATCTRASRKITNAAAVVSSKYVAGPGSWPASSSAASASNTACRAAVERRVVDVDVVDREALAQVR